MIAGFDFLFLFSWREFSAFLKDQKTYGSVLGMIFLEGFEGHKILKGNGLRRGKHQKMEKRNESHR
jgi:hypothetical protein